MALKHLHKGLTRTIEPLQHVTVHFAASDGRNLAATEDTVAHHATVERHARLVDDAVVDIAAAKHIAGLYQQRVGRFLGVVFYLLNVFAVFVFIADVALVELQVGRTVHCTTLAAAVGIALDGGDAAGEAAAVEITDNHMGLSGNVRCGRLADLSVMQTDIALPAAAIDVTTSAALNVGRGRGGEAKGISVITRRFLSISAYSGKAVTHGSRRAGSIDIFAHLSAKQGDIGAAIYVAAQCYIARTQAAAVGIVHDFGALVDNDVGVVNILALRLFFLRVSGVVSLVNLCLPHQRGVSQSGKSFEIIIVVSVRRVVSTQRPGIYPVFFPHLLVSRVQRTVTYFTSPACRIFPRILFCNIR